MVNLVDAFAEFVACHPEFSLTDKQKLSDCLKQLLDADPEKEIMRRALEHYANEYNWPYETEHPDGFRIAGMEEQESTAIARNALHMSEQALAACLHSMYEDQFYAQTLSDVHPMKGSRVA